MNALRQLIEKLSHGTALNGDDIIALLLVVSMLVSLGHLMTMLATRWGDRHTAFKSLLASILVHGVCILGLEVFEPVSVQPMQAETLPQQATERFTEVLVESDQDVPLSESGNTPLADRPAPPGIELQRLETTSPEITRAELPGRTPDELESLNTSVQDVTQFEHREMTELAVPTDAGELGPKQPAAEDPAADIKSAFDQNSADVFALESTRTMPQTGRPENARRAADPSIPLTAPELEFETPKNDVSMSLAADQESAIELPSVTENPADVIERRTAPAVAPEGSDGSAIVMNSSEPKSGAAATFQPRLPRPSRSVPDREPALRPSRMTPDRALTPTPLTDAYEDVRIGDLAPNFSEALLSGAALTEADLPTIQRRENPPTTYKLRNLATRRDASLKFGGTRESETAVERSLRWMVANQSTDGRWDAEDFGAGQVRMDENGVDRESAGREADTGLTALVTLSFLGAGYTHENGQYALEVDRALDWLIGQQGSDGNLCGNAEHYARMYCHAMATYALAEAYGMQDETLLGPIIQPEVFSLSAEFMELAAANTAMSVTSQQGIILLAASSSKRRMEAEQISMSLRKVDDLRLRAALAKAIAFTMGQQDPESGGWRYKFLQEGDVSMFGWQMMSLKSAEIAGVSVPNKVRERMDGFLNSVRQGKSGGLFGYRRSLSKSGQETEPVSPTMTAEALFCQQMLGYPHDSESSRESVLYLMQNTPRLSEANYYYWYYGTLAMYQYGGRPWQQWNSVVRDLLISEQVQSGPNAGSWDPNDKWGRYGGRLYSTALATLTLEVYYRFLPLYRMKDTQNVPNR